jgi:hypothetical protein
MKTISKFALLNAFSNGLPLVVGAFQFSVINRIEREDGSNRSYNITGNTANGEKTICVRTEA